MAVLDTLRHRVAKYPELQQRINRKRFVRYEEGAEM